RAPGPCGRRGRTRGPDAGTRRPAAAPPARLDRRPHAPLLGRPRPARPVEPVRRDLGEGDPGSEPAGVRGRRPRAASGGAGGGGGGGDRLLPLRGGRSVKFYYFHLMPSPMDHAEPSSWVTLSNR